MHSRVFAESCAAKPISLANVCLQTLLLLFLYFPINLWSQSNYEQELIKNSKLATTDNQKISSLNQLAEFYYVNKDFSKGDSIIERELMIAEAKRDKNLLIQVFFTNPGYNSSGLATQDRSQKTTDYINRALEYATAEGLTYYIALCYSNLAKVYTTEGKPEKAFDYANLGFTTALSSEDDSAKVLCAIQMGNIYLQQGKTTVAYKTFTHALDLAVHSGKQVLLPPVYHAIADLYKKLDNIDLSKDYLFKSLDANQESKNLQGQMEDYISLAQIYPYQVGKDYLLRAEKLADALHNIKQKLDAQRKLFSYMMLEEKPAVALDYLNRHPDLKRILTNSGPHYIDWTMASVYLYGKMPGEALYYFKIAEPSFREGYDFSTRKAFFGELAYCYKEVKDYPNAIKYYSTLVDLSTAVSDLFTLKSATNELRELYNTTGDYKQAYQYSILYDQYNDSVQQVSKEKDLALMEIDNEAKARDHAAQLAKEQQIRSYNLQYIGITLIIVIAFISLVALGMFKVSQLTIRALGFISFIFLFEFIIMLMDNWIHNMTDGQPFHSWLIKIGVISILLPLHHYFEHRVIRYLLTHKLLLTRPAFSFAALIDKITPGPDHHEPGEVKEESTPARPKEKITVVNYKLPAEDK